MNSPPRGGALPLTERIMPGLRSGFLTRTWMKGNLKRLVLLCGISGLLLLSVSGALLAGQPRHALLAIALFLPPCLFVAFFTGLERGLFLKPLCRLPGNEKRVAVTFDDGPHREHTPRLLDVLSRAGVKGTFFLLGRQVARHPGIAKRLFEEGHAVGSHGYSHRSLSWAGPAAVAGEIEKAESELRRIGIAAGKKLFRPPHGSKSPVLEWHLRARGYRLVHWNLSPKDWKPLGREVLLRRMLSYLRPGTIILLHDLPGTVEVLPDFIDEARRQGYSFVTVNEVP